jgi:hypothetical protein
MADDEHRTDSTAPSNDVLLRRILAAVEAKPRRRLEVLAAVLLSVTTLASTWCGYQASRWGGESSARQAAADTAERAAGEARIAGLERRTQDGLVLLEFWRAMHTSDAKAVEVMRRRMHTSLLAAVDASIAAGFLEHPDQPGPLHRPEYRLEEEVEAAEQRATAVAQNVLAARASDVSSDYVLLTLLCASILFFGGIATTFDRRGVRVALVAVAAVLFLVAIVVIVRLPTLL